MAPDRCTTSILPAISPFQANTGTPAAAIAAAAWSCVEKMLQLAQRTRGAQVDQRLDQHRGLDGHVQRAGDAHALQRLAGRVLLADGHQAGHFVLGDGDFLAAPLGQAHVGDFVVGSDGSERCGAHLVSFRNLYLEILIC